ncbi:MAG: TauD/TfdA family dioxygenase [Fimbriimonadaceae bacterium]|nr:MAG: TauD/TfdA family dioxygenase [Fimbriimonadaceae bacterium]
MSSVEIAVNLAKATGFGIVSDPLGQNAIDCLGHYITWTKKDDMLSPKRANGAQSYSGQYGLSEFPLHTDFAEERVPPRVLALICIDPGKMLTPTLVMPLMELKERKKLLDCICEVRTRNGNFTSSVVSNSKGELLLRYEKHAMSPMGRYSKVIFDHFLDDIKPTLVRLSKGQILLIDNWCCLHGRGAVAEESSDRRILRKVGNWK